MNVDNNGFLKNQVKIMGHGGYHDETIDQNMQQGIAKFDSEKTTEYFNRKVKAELHFSRGNEKEMYFWNGFTATHTKANGLETKQNFYVQTFRKENPETQKKEVKTFGFTLKEAANLLDTDHKGNSRAVFKEILKKDGTTYEAWQKLNLHAGEPGKHPVERFGKYDLEELVKGQDILENRTPKRLGELMDSLYKGNLQAVTMEINGESTRLYLAAAPEIQSLRVYDSKFKLAQEIAVEQKVGKEVSIHPDKTPQQSPSQVTAGQTVSKNGASKPTPSTVNEGQAKQERKGKSIETPVIAADKTQQQQTALQATGRTASTSQVSQVHADNSKKESKGEQVGDDALLTKSRKRGKENAVGEDTLATSKRNSAKSKKSSKVEDGDPLLAKKNTRGDKSKKIGI